MHWWSSLITTGREGLRVQRAFAAPVAIARAVLGVLLATALGLLLDDPVAGAMASVGAFICGIGTLLNPLRHRVVNALGMAASFSAMSVLGALVHGTVWLFLLLLAVAAFAAGLWRTLGIAPGIRGCLTVIGLMITADLAPDVRGGLLMAGWIATGTGFIVVTQLLPPYGPRFAGQRRTLAALYTSLADASGAADSAAPVPYAPFTPARQSLDLLPQFSRPAAAAMFGLLGEAERIRRALQTVRPRVPAEEAGYQEARASAARILGDISRTVATGREHRSPGDVWTLLDAWAEASTAPSPRDLTARLRSAVQLARRSADDRLGDALEPHTEVPGLYAGTPSVAHTARRIRTQLHPQSPIFRHAVRLAVGVVVAEIIGRSIGGWHGLGISAHGFWVALTTMLVLFPEYGHTIARGWGRASGAVLGGLLAWVLSLPHWSPTGLTVVAVVLAAAAFLTLRTGQLMLNLWLTSWIVFLIHHVGGLPGPTAWARAADTVVGAALAVLIFLLWPTWSTRTLPGLLAEWLRVQDRLLPQLLTGYADVGAADPAALDTLRARSRQVREHLNAAAKQSHAEPAEHRGPWSTAQMDQITTEVSRVAGCATLLREHLPRTAQDTVPELTELADPLHEHLAALARAAAGAETVAPGALRSVFDSCTARSGLSTAYVGTGAPATAADGSISTSTSRAVALSSATVDALEALTATVASGHRHGHHAAAPKLARRPRG
ncbi:putative membrane protein YccC [Streptomyces sp. 3212.3]|uniref:FUSC family protein n=1 Tax=Streptomyces sp. 3212.3 TaxID=1938846 RepID=UPI000E2792ED|nr:FUSC family protein [Streptomyces sp. 3212.3]REE58133.1 putative membrane protein YccC [Streptomyces sp. 3212.3]